MTRIIRLTVLPFLLITCTVNAQRITSLRQKIQEIVATKRAVVGVAIIGNKGQDTLSFNGDRHFPLQSVFKFPIALTVLHQVDAGKFSLDQKMKIEKKDLLPNLYSPIRDRYPNGITLTIAEILKFTVSESDNVGCDLLLKLIGGPGTVEAYLAQNNLKDIAIKINEETQQADWDLQFKNWITPKATNEMLTKFYDNKGELLSQKSYDFIWKIMKETGTGKDRLKGHLPEHTIVAHKTGTSGTNKKGLTAAVNDIGIIFLPDGQHFLISVFVTNSKENVAVNEKIIADISKAAWEYFNTTSK